MSEEYPLFNGLRRISANIIKSPTTIVILIIIVLTLIYFLPVYSLLFLTAVFLSVTVGLTAHYLLTSRLFNHIGLTPVEQGVIGGVISGSVGFIVGTLASDYLQSTVSWGYAYDKQKSRLLSLRDEIKS